MPKQKSAVFPALLVIYGFGLINITRIFAEAKKNIDKIYQKELHKKSSLSSCLLLKRL
jgi:hypothetical protein